MAQYNRKKTYRVPVRWSLEGYHDVKAWNPEEACDIAEDLDLPHGNAEYIDGSCETLSDCIEQMDKAEQVEQVAQVEPVQATPDK